MRESAIATKVKIVDDDPAFRIVLSEIVKELNWQPIEEIGPLPSIEALYTRLKGEADYAIFDHNLRIKGSYAKFLGAEAVAYLYDKLFPAILCTTYYTADIDNMRKYIRKIPILITPDELQPDFLETAFKNCIDELNGKFLASRKAWRTLIRVEDVNLNTNPQLLIVVIPAWDAREKVRLPLEIIPNEKRENFSKPGVRFHAEVNIGAETSAELYFTDIDKA